MHTRHKIELLRHSIDEASPESLVALGLSFPRMRIRNLRSITRLTLTQNVKSSKNTCSRSWKRRATQHSLLWAGNLDQDFQMLDFGLLLELGLIEEDECLLLTKA
ncbi:hypothetical protein N5V81_13335 [Escherichia coli]|nr:hypothetical protein [Escherichia coli]